MLGGSGAGHASGVAPTLSGFTSAPRRERSLRLRGDGIGIRFRAPGSADLAVLHTYWRRPIDRCQASLRFDAANVPGQPLAAAPLPDGGQGWVAIPLAASLRAGQLYHLVVSCVGSSRARVGYVIDRDRSAERSGAWRLEVLRHGHAHRRRRGSPLFALVFADGQWWGQPYRAFRGRPRIRLCGADEAIASLVPSRTLVVRDVRLRRRRRVHFTLDASDGTTVLARPGPSRGARRPATLVAGATYTLRLRTPSRRRGCIRERALVTDLALGPALGGLELTGLGVRGARGRSWQDLAPSTLAVRLLGSVPPLGACGDGNVGPDEQCDGALAPACPGRCSAICTCRAPEPPPPGCGAECGGGPAPAYRSIYPSGYLGHYDADTIGVWPERLGLMLGEANAQGPLVAPARALADATGNGEARFIFYLSLTDMDSRCDCFDQRFYDGFRDAHPEWVLKDRDGNRVTTNNGIGRLFATDIGNPAYVDAWADYALAAAERWGWDGTFADNIFRGNFDPWSARPVNPRTGAAYTTAAYRADMLAAVERLRRRFDARGKILVGNHTSAWDPATFADPITRAEVLALGGVEVEDCVYDFNGVPHSERSWIAQLEYLAFANRSGVRTVCSGARSAIGHASQRDYLLATYLLTKEGLSSVSELNSVGDWWSGLEVDLGAPLGRYTCLDPAAGFATTAECPAPGKVYAREWEHGRVLVNPSGDETVTVPLEETFLYGGSRVRRVTLPPHQGVVLVRP